MKRGTGPVTSSHTGKVEWEDPLLVCRTDKEDQGRVNKTTYQRKFGSSLLFSVLYGDSLY